MRRMDRVANESDSEQGDDIPKITFFEYAYLAIVLTLSIAIACIGTHLIIFSDNELPTGPALMVVGAVMSGITILKFAAERKRALDPVKLHKAVFGAETMFGILIAVIGIIWYLIV